MQWLKHAFAVDPPGPAEPTDEQRLAIDRVVEEVVRREEVAHRGSWCSAAAIIAG